MSDISLLPQSFRDKEEELKKTQQATAEAGGTLMHVPTEEAEDVEVIEVEEGEVDQILKSEPLLSRLIYKSGVWLESVKDKLFKRQSPEPPPKLPPQFFKPTATAIQEKPKPSAAQPAPGLPLAPGPSVPPVQPSMAASKPAVVVTPTPRPKARIIPSGATPRRVRIIKRIHKPMHVSLLDENLVRQLQVNVPKRQFTLAFLTVFFAAVFTAAFLLLDRQNANALATEQNGQQEMQTLQGQITDLQKQWSAYKDLEPRLITLNDLLDSHISMVHALKFLEQHTLSSVSYGNLLLDSTGHVNLNVSAPSFETAAKQLQIFHDAPEIKTADATAFNYTPGKQQATGEVDFQLSLVFQVPALQFEKPLSNP